jgi:anti-sigma B factor antagonist
MDTIEPANPARLQISYSRDPHDAPVLALRGELDIATATTLDDAFRSIDALRSVGPETAAADVAEPGPVTVVLDLSQLTFMDSSGLAVLLSAVHRGYRLRLRQPSRIIRDIIEATGLAETLPVEP